LNTLKMSDTMMDTPDTESIHIPHSKVRVCVPDKYHGERNKLKAWLLQMDRHFHVEGDRIADEDKVVIATTYMKDLAEIWVTPHLERYLDNDIKDNENARLMENWDVFKAKLRQAFSPIKASVIAEKKIQTLRQTHSVADYTALFQQYQAQIEWDDAALIRMYKQGLKVQVREELMRSAARTDSLDELINEAIRLDNDLYELQIEARAYKHEYVPKKKGNPSYGRSHRQGQYRARGKGKARIPGHYGSEEFEDMHVDNVERGKPRSNSSAKYHGKGKPDNGKETRTCYNCNKPGHLAKNCRQPKKNTVSRYVNMIEHGEESGNEDDWQVIGRFAGPLNDSEEDLTRYRHDGPVPYDQYPHLSREDMIDPSSEEDLPEAKFSKMSLTKEHTQAPIDYGSPGQHKASPSYLQVTEAINRKAKGKVPWEEMSAKEFFEVYDRELQAPETTVQYLEELEQQRYNKQILQQLKKDGVAQLDEPHPGDKVYTAWDEEVTSKASDSPPYYRDNTDQVFVTPPDSPVLGRKKASRGQKTRASPPKDGKAGTSRSHRNDAVYANNREALVLYEEDTTSSATEARATMSTPEYEDWVLQAENNFSWKQKEHYHARKSKRSDEPNYATDPRNPHHGRMSWIACGSDGCQEHYSEKLGSGYFPRPQGCRWAPYDCPKHTCTRHLWDKRTTGVFPGLSEEQTSLNQVLLNDRCTNNEWQMCLRHRCTRHRQSKQFHGFDKLEEPFLGTDLKAVKHELKTATKSTRHPSTSSQ
jgi:hypothetical protein